MYGLKSLSIFFPFFNDEGTVERSIEEAYRYGSRVTSDLEVIAIHGGASRDKTFEKLLIEKKKHPDLKIVDKHKNKEGYAVIKYGFKHATKDWVFYTDGDLQYHLNDLIKLIQKQREKQADIVNGYRIARRDSFLRVLFGSMYRFLSKHIFYLPITDLTCDFRLIKRSFLKKLSLESTSSSILLELIKSLEKKGATFAQVQVKHYPRSYGSSSYNVVSLVKERLVGDLRVWVRLLADRNKGNSKR
ncbi:glycosyltransferase family 2 protein [Candidatus Roizmanbacteria bacterium]|nr:glycosyltransferase family 2 protein [Candidatus Roizmanbacteria bacterium]